MDASAASPPPVTQPVADPPTEPPVAPPAPPIEPPPVAQPPVVPDPDDVVGVLEPRTAPIARRLMDKEGRGNEYVQKELTAFSRLELYGLLGNAIKTAMSQEGGLGIDELVRMTTQPKDVMTMMTNMLPGADTAPDAKDKAPEVDLESATKIVTALAGLTAYVPDLAKDLFCIVLNVPIAHRPWMINFGLPTISDDEFEDILVVFVDQNWTAIEDFWRRRLPRIIKQATAARRAHAAAR